METKNNKSINQSNIGMGEKFVEILKNSRYKISTVSVKGRGKIIEIQDDPLLFTIVKIEEKKKCEDGMLVSFSTKKKRSNNCSVIIKFWNKDLFISLFNSGLKFGYNSYNELPKFYVVIPLDRIHDFNSMYLGEKKLVENY